MGELHSTFKRRTHWLAALRAAAFAVLGVMSFQALAEPLTLYLYKENGMPVYSDRKPAANVEYTVIRPGSGEPRSSAGITPTSFSDMSVTANKEGLVGWAASCQGVTKEVLEQRAQQWQAMVTKHAKAHGVPAALVRAVMRVESCFDPKAVSRAGAQGLMQLMPATATQMGVRDSFDADQNIAGGARYLSHLLGRFKNDTRLAIAAYNAGPAAVDSYRGIPPYAETRSYVQRVIAEYRVNSTVKVKQSKS
ncbi:lytic transglycosylase domain-containing protein [Stenotrophobium rhamnosiphilum]|uniref:Lytic transglycosylase n=1 Tax=Stenotrophobium rhamnosiphilum TaxID=2029166 RepID=A0A2T5MC43_9GAMM|nr:lytic transglycosylase domain-containing protein [Stenotrophobium rhamnosiphilum]PTU30142.1 lytic transglycosylase [Stenotrophobium rhamnosiphilum]